MEMKKWKYGNEEIEMGGPSQPPYVGPLMSYLLCG